MASKLTGRMRGLAARVQSEDAQGLAEYGLILGLIAVACIAALTATGTTIAGSSGFVDIPSAL